MKKLLFLFFLIAMPVSGFSQSSLSWLKVDSIISKSKSYIKVNTPLKYPDGTMQATAYDSAKVAKQISDSLLNHPSGSETYAASGVYKDEDTIKLGGYASVNTDVGIQSQTNLGYIYFHRHAVLDRTYLGLSNMNNTIELNETGLNYLTQDTSLLSDNSMVPKIWVLDRIGSGGTTPSNGWMKWASNKYSPYANLADAGGLYSGSGKFFYNSNYYTIGWDEWVTDSLYDNANVAFNGQFWAQCFFGYHGFFIDSKIGSPNIDGTWVDINSHGVTSPKFFVTSLNTPPYDSEDGGTVGEIRICSDYIYVCIATNTWVRAALSTW